MAKGQQRSGREARKPKKEKVKTIAANPSQKAARGLESGASEEQLIAMGGAVRIFIDADACPVKEEVYRVAFRREVPVKVVSNAHPITRPSPDRAGAGVRRVRRRRRLDRGRGGRTDGGDHQRHIARRPLPEGGRDRHRQQRQAVHQREHRFCRSATRAIMADLRAGGDVAGGPAVRQGGPVAVPAGAG